MFDDIISVPYSQIFHFFKVPKIQSTEYFVYYSKDESHFWVFENSDRSKEINCLSGKNFEIITKQSLLLHFNQNIDFSKIDSVVTEIRKNGIDKEEVELEEITVKELKRLIFSLVPAEELEQTRLEGKKDALKNADFKEYFAKNIYGYEPGNCLALPFFKDDKMCDVLLFDENEAKMLYGIDDCFWQKLISENDILIITINPLNISKENVNTLQSSLIIPSPEFSKNVFMKITKLMKEKKIRKIEMLCNKSSFKELIFTLKYVVEFCNFITKLNYSLQHLTNGQLLGVNLEQMHLSLSFSQNEVKHLEVIQFVSNLKQALRKELGIKPEDDEKEKLFDQYNYRELQTEYQDKVIINIKFIAKVETLVVLMCELIEFSSIEKKMNVIFV